MGILRKPAEYDYDKDAPISYHDEATYDSDLPTILRSPARLTTLGKGVNKTLEFFKLPGLEVTNG